MISPYLVIFCGMAGYTAVLLFGLYQYLLMLYDDVLHGWRLSPLQRFVLRIVGKERLMKWGNGADHD